MEITGSDYTYWSNIPAEKTAASFLNKVHQMWPAAQVDDERRNGDIEMFVSKDAAMDDFHDGNGYALNDDDEGCFMFAAQSYPAPFQSAVRTMNITSPASLMSASPHDSTIFLANPTRYTLVLPTLREDSDFSQKIHAFLIDSLSESAAIG